MVARSAYTQLNYSLPLLAGTLLGLLFLYALPPAAAITGLAAGLGGPAPRPRRTRWPRPPRGWRAGR